MRVGVLHGPNVLIVHHVFRPDNSVQILEVGASIPWHACALGKAIVAYLAEASAAALVRHDLAPLTGRTVTDPERLRAGAHHGGARRSARWRTRKPSWGKRRSPPLCSITAGYPAGASASWARSSGSCPKASRVGSLSAAVRETARGFSRDMGAGRVAARG